MALWVSSPLGQFRTRSAYHRFNVGAVEFEPWKEIWRSWAPPHHRFFVRLASQKCWTSDCLAHQGHDHPEQSLYVIRSKLYVIRSKLYNSYTLHVCSQAKFGSVFSLVGLQHQAMAWSAASGHG